MKSNCRLRNFAKIKVIFFCPFFFFFFYLQSVILGSGFPQHGVSVGGGWMWTWRAGWRGVGAEGVERSELVGETMREFVRMGAEAVREGRGGAGGDTSRGCGGWKVWSRCVRRSKRRRGGRGRKGLSRSWRAALCTSGFPYILKQNAGKIFFRPSLNSTQL